MELLVTAYMRILKQGDGADFLRRFLGGHLRSAGETGSQQECDQMFVVGHGGFPFSKGGGKRDELIRLLRPKPGGVQEGLFLFAGADAASRVLAACSAQRTGDDVRRAMRRKLVHGVFMVVSLHL